MQTYGQTRPLVGAPKPARFCSTKLLGQDAGLEHMVPSALQPCEGLALLCGLRPTDRRGLHGREKERNPSVLRIQSGKEYSLRSHCLTPEMGGSTQAPRLCGVCQNPASPGAGAAGNTAR